MLYELEKKIVGPLTEKTAPALRKHLKGWIRDNLGMYSNTGKEDGGFWLYLKRDYKKHSYTKLSIPYGSDVYTDCDGDLHIALPDGMHLEFSYSDGALKIKTELYKLELEKEATR